MSRTSTGSVPASSFLAEQVLPFLDSVLFPKWALGLPCQVLFRGTRIWAVPDRPIVGGLSGIPMSMI